MKEFIELDKYGKLYIDKILFETYFPIIFNCITDNKDMFFCVCCQNNENGCKWLVGKTNGISIAKMLQNKITIRQLLLDFSVERITVDYKNKEYAIRYNNSDWNEESKYLPKVDSYMYAEEGEFDEEIKYFSSIDRINYNKEYYINIMEELGTISKTIEPIADVLTEVSHVIGNITISSEVLKTLEVFGKLHMDVTKNIGKYAGQQKNSPTFMCTFNTSTEKLTVEIETDDNRFAEAA